MTVYEANELSAAIDRAERNDIQVIAQGRFKANNARFYLTNSHSEPDRVHVVRLVGSRLVCDCKSKVICAHRGAAHVYLVNEAARKQRNADMVERALICEAKTKLAAQAIVKSQVRGVNDTRPISIFK